MTTLRVGVTGAAGQVGSALVDALASSGEFQVVAVTRNAAGARLLSSVSADVRVGSITDPNSAARLLGDCQAVLNCALAKGLPRAAGRDNRTIIRNIASLPNVRTVVCFSSVAVYGTCIDPVISTFERPRPDTEYGREKLRLEHCAAHALAASSRRYYVLRLGHVYGPAQTMSRVILDLLRTVGFALPFGGTLASNAVAVTTMASQIWRLLTVSKPSGVYNLADSPATTWRQVFDLHTDAWGLPPAASLGEDRSRALRSEYLRAARRGAVSAAVAEVRRLLESVCVSDLSKPSGLRQIADRLMAVLPRRAEETLRSDYVRRSVRSALAELNVGRVRAPDWLCSGAMPGRYLCAAEASDESDIGQRQLRAALETWFRRTTSYRWDPAEFGLRP